MNRKEFLKMTGSGSALLLGGTLLPDISCDLKKVIIYDNYIKGMRHYLKREEVAKFKQGQKVNLLRDETNIHDSFAIRVMDEDRKIGYVSAFENIVLANMMDQGVQLEAQINEVNASPDRYLSDAVAISISTKLMVPISGIHQEPLTQQPADEVKDRYRGEMIHRD